MKYYHGGKYPVTCIGDAHFGADGELLCATQSVNVALRYGETITQFSLNTEKIKRMDLVECFHGPDSYFDLRKKGFDLLILTSSDENYDFPVETLFVLNSSALKFDCVLTNDEIKELDDGLSTKHDPDGPSDKHWALWLSSLGIEEEEALLDRGWTVVESGGYEYKNEGESGYSPWVVRVTPGEDGHWEASFQIGDDTPLPSIKCQNIEQALALADHRRVEEINAMTDQKSFKNNKFINKF